MAKKPDSGTVDELAMGRMGGVVITDTNAHTGTFGALQIIEAASVTMTLTAAWSGTISALSLAAGTVLRVQFTSVTLASGKAIAYSE